MRTTLLFVSVVILFIICKSAPPCPPAQTFHATKGKHPPNVQLGKFLIACNGGANAKWSMVKIKNAAEAKGYLECETGIKKDCPLLIFADSDGSKKSFGKVHIKAVDNTKKSCQIDIRSECARHARSKRGHDQKKDKTVTYGFSDIYDLDEIGGFLHGPNNVHKDVNVLEIEIKYPLKSKPTKKKPNHKKSNSVHDTGPKRGSMKINTQVNSHGRSNSVAMNNANGHDRSNSVAVNNANGHFKTDSVVVPKDNANGHGRSNSVAVNKANDHGNSGSDAINKHNNANSRAKSKKNVAKAQSDIDAEYYDYHDYVYGEYDEYDQYVAQYIAGFRAGYLSAKQQEMRSLYKNRKKNKMYFH